MDGTKMTKLHDRFCDFINAEPFRPFVIRLSNVQTHVIERPERIFVGRTKTQVHESTEHDGPPRWRDVSLTLIESLEPLATSAN